MKRELLQQLSDLPRLYEEIASDCRDLDQVLEFYRAFLSFLKVHQDDEFLPILRHILAKGSSLDICKSPSTLRWKEYAGWM